MISVIVPVYNAEEFLSVCLDSLLAQTYQELEILLVDDGSTDRSFEICQGYAAKDSRIRVLHQENQGVGAARNTGINAASGGYLSFIDADDYVAKDYFERLCRDMVDFHADIVCCNLTEIFRGETVQILPLPLVQLPRLVTESRELYADIVGDQEAYWSCSTCKLIKTDLAKKFRFTSLKYGEDQVFMFDLFSTGPVVYLDDYPGYYYVRNDSSATMRKGSDSIARCMDELTMYEYKLSNLPDTAAEVKDRYRDRCALGVHALARAVVISGSPEERKAYRKMLCGKIQELFTYPQAISTRNKLYLGLYRYLPWLYRWLLLVKNRHDINA